MPTLPAKLNRDITPYQKAVKTEIKFGRPFMVPDLILYKFQMMDLKGNLSYWAETKCSRIDESKS